MKSLFQRMASITRDESGTGVALYSSFLGVSLLICGYTINLGFSFTHGEALQHAIDVAAISTGELYIDNPTMTDAQLDDYAQKIVALNLKAGGVNTSGVVPDVQKVLDSSSNVIALDVVATLTTPTYFFQTFQPTTTKTARYSLSGGGKPVIVSLALETSSWNLDAEMTATRDAAIAFVNQLSLGDYFSVVSFSDVYCVPVPMVRIATTTGTGQMTKADITAQISTMQRQCGVTDGPLEKTYVQGGIFKARKEILSLRSTLGDDWNQYAKYIVLTSDCRVTSSTTRLGWPLADEQDLDGLTNGNPSGFPQGECNGSSFLGSPNALNSHAAAIHQGDLSRREGIELLVIGLERGTYCAGTSGARREQALRRIADDTSWDGTSTSWQTTPTAQCAYYSPTMWCRSGQKYKVCSSSADCDSTTGAGDGQCAPITPAAKTRYWKAANPTTTITSLMSSRAGAVKRGRLTS